MEIDGEGHTIDGGNLYRIFLVNSGQLTLKNVTIENGLADQSGGAGVLVLDNASLVIENSTIQGNKGVSGNEMRGGGVHAFNSQMVQITSTSFIQNSVEGNAISKGGGLSVTANEDNVALQNLYFIGNDDINSNTDSSIYLEGNTIEFTNSCIESGHLAGASVVGVISDIWLGPDATSAFLIDNEINGTFNATTCLDPEIFPPSAPDFVPQPAGNCPVTVNQFNVDGFTELALRSVPSLQSRILTRIPADTQLVATYRIDSFFQVNFNGILGWITTDVAFVNYDTNCTLSPPYPADWVIAAQVTASDITDVSNSCNPIAYLQSEPATIAWARVAYAEASIYNRGGGASGGVVFEDAIRIAWVARLDAFLGLKHYDELSTAGSTVPIVDQLVYINSLGNPSFQPVQKLQNRLPIVGCEAQQLSSDFDNNIKKSMYPTGSDLYELWIIYRDIIDTVRDANWSTFPTDIQGHDQFKGVSDPTPASPLSSSNLIIDLCAGGGSLRTRPGSGLIWTQTQPYESLDISPYLNPSFPAPTQLAYTCYQDAHHLDQWFFDQLPTNPSYDSVDTFPMTFSVGRLQNPCIANDFYFLAQMPDQSGNLFPPATTPECNQ